MEGRPKLRCGRFGVVLSVGYTLLLFSLQVSVCVRACVCAGGRADGRACVHACMRGCVCVCVRVSGVGMAREPEL